LSCYLFRTYLQTFQKIATRGSAIWGTKAAQGLITILREYFISTERDWLHDFDQRGVLGSGEEPSLGHVKERIPALISSFHANREHIEFPKT
jgi:hypothetical protein